MICILILDSEIQTYIILYISAEWLREICDWTV